MTTQETNAPILLVPYTRQRKAEQLLASAKVAAIWSGPPMADEVRQRDQERLLEGPLLRDAPSDEDLALGGKLLAGSTPEATMPAMKSTPQAAITRLRWCRTRPSEPAKSAVA